MSERWKFLTQDDDSRLVVACERGDRAEAGAGEVYHASCMVCQTRIAGEPFHEVTLSGGRGRRWFHATCYKGFGQKAKRITDGATL